MGGFECSSHMNKAGRRLDLIEATRHEEFAFTDYERLRSLGISTARDGVRWHLIEKQPFEYDFSSLEPLVLAANRAELEIIWDYFHYGYPSDLDIFSKEFSDRFASFARATTAYLTENLNGPLHICPVNEISFFSWIAADKGVFHPAVKGRADELKKRLIEASLEAVKAIRAVNGSATVMFTEPAIHVIPRNDSADARRAAEAYRRLQFRAFDQVEMARKKIDCPMNDVIGLNYYFHNQWRHPSRRKIPRGHKLYRPLNEILSEFHARYQLPILIAETGIEDDERAEWFRYVCDQTAIAIDNGVRIQGICLYPIVNHPGWADDRHCQNGLWEYADDSGYREIYSPLAEEVVRQIARFDDLFKDQESRAISSPENRSDGHSRSHS
jgi:beta-glucosidase/6-phospho-beta-glucosidase/beta-galactosidase